MLSHTDVKYWEMIHPEANKRTQDAYPAKCDICGGSRTNPREQKLYLYTKNDEKSFVRCHHGKCEYSGTFLSYLKKFHPSYYNMYKSENSEASLNDLLQEFNKTNLSNLSVEDEWGVIQNDDNDIDIDNTAHLNNNTIYETIDKIEGCNELYDLNQYFIPITQHPDAYNYIKSRNIPINEDWMFSLIDLEIGNTLYKISGNIIIPLKRNNQWYGFYSRGIHNKEFVTFIPLNNNGYKVWNWFNVDKTQPVYIFESIFDAISSGKTNIIATLGGSLNKDRLSEIQFPIFCFDNDEAGFKLTMKELSNNPKAKAVLLPSEFKNIKDYNELAKNYFWTLPQISTLIDNNTFDAFNALVRLQMILK